MTLPSRLSMTALFEVALIVCWSSGFIGGTLASATASIFGVLFWRFLLAAMILLPFAWRGLRQLSPLQFALQGLIGSLAMFGYLATVISAIDYGVPAGTAALITALQPLATAALAGTFLGESVSPRQWVGLLIGFAGVGIAVAGSLEAAPLGGYLLAVLSMACIVAATLIARARAGAIALLPSLAIQTSASALLFLPLAVFDGALAPELTVEFIYAVGWFIALSTLGAYGLYWACLVRTSATRVSSLIYMTPPVTTVWAFLMFNEPITPEAVMGFFVCLLGVYLAQNRCRMPAASHPAPACAGRS